VKINFNFFFSFVDFFFLLHYYFLWVQINSQERRFAVEFKISGEGQKLNQAEFVYS